MQNNNMVKKSFPDEYTNIHTVEIGYTYIDVICMIKILNKMKTHDTDTCSIHKTKYWFPLELNATPMDNKTNTKIKHWRIMRTNL